MCLSEKIKVTAGKVENNRKAHPLSSLRKAVEGVASRPRFSAARAITVDFKQKSAECTQTADVPLAYENRDGERVIMASRSRIMAPKFNLDNLGGAFTKP